MQEKDVKCNSKKQNSNTVIRRSAQGAFNFGYLKGGCFFETERLLGKGYV